MKKYPHWKITKDGKVSCKGMTGKVINGELIVSPNGQSWSWGKIPQEILERLERILPMLNPHSIGNLIAGNLDYLHERAYDNNFFHKN